MVQGGNRIRQNALAAANDSEEAIGYFTVPGRTRHETVTQLVGNSAWFMIRFQDVNNFVRAYATSSGMRVAQRVNGVDTVLHTNSVGGDYRRVTFKDFGAGQSLIVILQNDEFTISASTLQIAPSEKIGYKLSNGSKLNYFIAKELT